MLQEQQQPFEVVNLTDSSKEHIGILMSNFEINQTQLPNSNLETRIFRLIGDKSSCCTNCGCHSSKEALLMGDYYDKNDKELWIPRANRFKNRKIEFYHPMLTSQAFVNIFGEITPKKVQEKFQLPHDFWEEHTNTYVRKLIKRDNIQEAYRQILYQISTTSFYDN